jgi:protein-S-isoprenylcysteine O-methyltransferase Ste14
MGFIVLAFGAVSYLVFFGVFLYAIAFVGNLGVPRSIDVGPAAPFAEAVVVNLILLALFAAQHSIMARPGFKRVWTRLVPKSIERSTYVLLSSLALALLYWQWRPLPGAVWHVESALGRGVLQALFWLGWLMVLAATFMISHFDLFGLRQVWLRAKGVPYTHLPFRTTALYAFVRNPIMLGFLIAFWATPDMTLGHLLFAGATSGYIVIGTWLEERDLIHFHGALYQRYQEEVPMFVPLPGRRARETAAAAARQAGERSAAGS